MPRSLSREELIAWANESVAFYGIDIDRISTVFLAQSFSMQVNHVFSTFDLTQPIKVLEGLTPHDGTGIEQTFKHKPLLGLYKKHFSSPRFLVKNLANFAHSKLGREHFQKIWDEAVQASSTGIIDEQFTKYIAHHMTVDPIQMKSESQSVTGEWLVFHKHEGKNYYLTLAAHDEGDQTIYERALLACDFDNLPFRIGDA